MFPGNAEDLIKGEVLLATWPIVQNIECHFSAKQVGRYGGKCPGTVEGPSIITSRIATLGNKLDGDLSHRLDGNRVIETRCGAQRGKVYCIYFYNSEH